MIDQGSKLELRISETPPLVSPNVDVKKIIVAVHGIGDQTSYATIQSALFRFCSFFDAPAAVPLGRFYNEKNVPLTLVVPPFPDPFKCLAFAEVYWANVPRENAKTYSLEEAQKWAKTIVERVRQRSHESKKLQAPNLAPRQKAANDAGDPRDDSSTTLEEEDFPILEQVLTEMLQTVGVLGRLCFLAEKAGIFTFDLNKVLVDYLGDVQVVTEFQTLRNEILKTFDDVMQRVHKAHEKAEIYIIAHSEGTVVALLGLLQALSNDKTPDWVKRVRGFMTIGSPIDKHLVLWPELFDFYRKQQWVPAPAIEWRNYYDKGDPIGFNLDTIRTWLKGEWGDFKLKWKGIHFEDCHDHGFTRYAFPGKAHNDYWGDDAVFGHFIQTVVAEKPAPSPLTKKVDYTNPPADIRWKKRASYVFPYVGAFALLFVAVFVLYKAVNAYIHPPPDESLETTRQVFMNVGAFTLLLAGLTVMARIPRLKRTWRWRLLGIGIFIVSAIGFRVRLGEQFRWLIPMAAAIVIVTYSLYFLRRRSPSPGTTTLLLTGGLGVAIVIVKQIAEEKGPDVGPLWPVLLAAAAFFYLWWLVVLIFDLTFIWHRYIHTSDVTKYLHNIGREHGATQKARES